MLPVVCCWFYFLVLVADAVLWVCHACFSVWWMPVHCHEWRRPWEWGWLAPSALCAQKINWGSLWPRHTGQPPLPSGVSDWVKMGFLFCWIFHCGLFLDGTSTMLFICCCSALLTLSSSFVIVLSDTRARSFWFFSLLEFRLVYMLHISNPGHTAVI